MPPGLAKEWFIRGDGIDRHVISSDIQRYLGNDATVRPGVGTGPEQGVKGYWVKAYRNLTTAMVDDLRASTIRWQTEQRRTGTRDHYVDSEAYTQAQAGNRMPPRHAGDSPLGAMDPRYQDMPPGRNGRMPDRMQIDDRMPIDPPFAQSGPGRFPPDRGDRHPGDSRPFQQGGPSFPPHDRDPRDRGSYDGPEYGRNMQYGADMRDPMRDPRDPRDSGRGDPRDPRGAPGYPQVNGIPNDYGRQQDYYGSGPNNANYGGAPPMNAMPRGHDPSMNPATQFGAPPGPPRNGDPRYGAPPNNYGSDMRDPRDPRYAYPSPAQSTVDPRDSNFQSGPQHNTFGHNGPPQGNMNPQFDQYGGRPPPPPNQMSNAFANPQGPPGILPGANPNSLPGNRPRPPQGNIGSGPRASGSPADLGIDSRDPRRRRLQ